jgi:hypothetical protein
MTLKFLDATTLFQFDDENFRSYIYDQDRFNIEPVVTIDFQDMIDDLPRGQGMEECSALVMKSKAFEYRWYYFRRRHGKT